MKAEISADGVLSIVPETPLESFALNAWGNRNIGMRKIHDEPACTVTFEVSNLVLSFKGDELSPGIRR